MTKRRPSWSDGLRRAAALACGLLLLNGSPAFGAAGHKPSTKAAGKAAKAPARKVPHRAARHKPAKGPGHGEPAPEVGAAEIIDRDTRGLHGAASFYGSGFQGRRTSTGERFDLRQFTGASNHFPLGTMVAVRRLDNDRCAIVKINDRMQKHRRRIIDVSRGVAEHLGMIQAGVVLVRVAPLKAGWSEQDLGACSAAFELPAGGQAPRLPGFDGF